MSSGAGFAFAAVIPPLALFGGEVWIAGLGDSGAEGVENARIDTLAGEALEAGAHFPGVLLGELRDGADAELIEIAEHGWADGDEVGEVALGGHGWSP